MADISPRLLLPYLQAAQAQKHVTHNEALRRLDGLVNLTVEDRNRSTPPTNPVEGTAYLVAAGASGLWAGWSGDIALWANGAWMRLPARIGWRLWVIAEQVMLVRLAAGWVTVDAAMGLLVRSTSTDLAEGPLGSRTRAAVIEASVTGLSGSSVTTTLTIPAGALVIGISARITIAITGATGFALGIAGEPAAFGAVFGIGAGSLAQLPITPRAFALATLVRASAEGGSFTGGALRIACHTLSIGAPA
jgi:hypothetical protein